MESSPHASNDVLQRFAALVAEHLAEKLRPILPHNDTGGVTYNTRNLPPDAKSVRSFHLIVKGITGAWKSGRVWFVPKEAWDAARQARRGRAPREAAVLEADAEFVERVLTTAQTRATRKSAAR